MPFDTVNEQYVRERKILVCERCRRPMDSAVQNRQAYQTGGSIAGSLGGSVGGSMLAGAVLGPVGALAGAIGGALAGSRAGAVATDGICDAVDSTGSQICNSCKEAAATRPAGYQNWGGGRLGAGDASDHMAAQAPVAPGAPSEPSIGDRISETASSAGKHLGEAASSVGESLSGVGSWMRKSVTSMTGGETEGKPEASKKEAFKPFAGAGQPLVAEKVDRSAARTAAAEAAMRRAGQAPPSSSSAAAQPAPAADQAQLADDEALARRLQEQFDAEDADTAR
mmetsp:Transcript_91540/g.112103  ORF Transcript_91540/g.112103 Transcript_91540/m.112103 type:complete len:282 (-) Transcript_91540:67-912(-)|eukprot:CAMPEP_0114686798 /NCGR_PEP_ID=MMETSP0191-20121206/61855_1 /TAXON_ID=126664 /ORGANISM="Sorites sp." /LENGTH=281 /DNA_ID=CAMNT_0001972675 /DNA_START=16 /DNA_END=861 /DNA_ORIENTATION=-